MERTVDKAFRLLEALAASREARGVTELSVELGLTKSNTHRLLTTLVDRGYVIREDGGSYRLSLKIWQLGAGVVATFDLRAVALPHLRQVRDLTGETARLTVLNEYIGVCIEQVESKNPVYVHAKIGDTLYLHCSSTGKALLAYQSEEFIAHVSRDLRAFTSNTIRDAVALQEELQRTRERGFAVNLEEWVIGVRGIGAPVFDRSGRVAGSIGISGPADRLTDSRIEACAKTLVECARQVSHDAGFVPP